MLELDAIDRRILEALRHDGRISMLDLAGRVGLSPTPCARRVRRLEEGGVILGYSARIDPKAEGLGVSVLVAVRLAKHGTEGTRQFLSAISGRPEITECLLVAGSIDYMLRVAVPDLDALGSFIRNVLQSIPSVAETTTMVILKQDEIRPRR